MPVGHPTPTDRSLKYERTTSRPVIRYVLAVALTVSILGAGLTAVERGSAVHGERTLETAVTDVESAALELYGNEALAPPGARPPQRLLEVELPTGGPADEPAARFGIRRLGRDHSRITYRLSGRTRHTETLAVPLVTEGRSLDLGGETGTVQIRLRLVTDADGRPVVEIGRR